jgi:peptidoglycan/LPS O-acetylase OafA/YrhL
LSLSTPFSPRETFPALTGIRALGAMLVFIYHILPAGSPHFLYGMNVLSFFFVLSGFLIVYIYNPTVSFSRQWLSSYFINRFARIYPVYFLLVTIAILLKADFRPLLLFKNYTLTHALFNNLRDIAIGPSWSLTVEECFYALAPLMMLLIRRPGLVACFAFCTGLLCFALSISLFNISLLQTPVFIFTTTFFGHFFEFLAGIVLAIAVLKWEYQPSGSFPKWTIIGGMGIILMLPLLANVGHLALRIAINNFLIAIPTAIFYFGLIYERSVVSRILSTHLFDKLGKSSYAFYLLHTLVITYIAQPYLLPFFGGIWLLYVVIVYIFTCAIAWIIYAWYEQPLNRIIRKNTIPRLPAPQLQAK